MSGLQPLGQPRHEFAALFQREVRTAPTLVKYAQPNEYLVKSQADLAHAAAELSQPSPPKIRSTPSSILSSAPKSLVELALRCFIRSHHSYRAIRDLVTSWPAARVNEIIELGLRRRGERPRALRAFHAGAALRFDILMDIGGFRDMPPSPSRKSSRDSPPPTATNIPAPPIFHPTSTSSLKPASSAYTVLVQSAHQAAATIAAGSAPEAARSAMYLARSPPASARFSKWTLQKPSTSPNCAPLPRPLQLSAHRLANVPRAPGAAPRWRATSASPTTKPIDIFQR